MLDLGRHLGHGHGVEPAQAAHFACGVAQAVEDHRPHEGIGLDLAPPGSHGAPKGAVETKVIPKLVQGKDVAIGLRAFDLDGKGRVVAPPDRPVQALDQRIELGGAQIFEAAKVGDNPVADLPLIIAIAALLQNSGRLGFTLRIQVVRRVA